MAQRHDGVRNLLASLIGKVCTNAEVKPQLQPLDNERFNFGRAVTSPEARLDFKAGGVWSRGVTPLVLGTNVGMGADCNCFLKRLAEKLSEKNEEPYHTTIAWIRKLLSSEILRSVHTCVRGSRTPFNKIPQRDFIDDCRLNGTQACVLMA